MASNSRSHEFDYTYEDYNNYEDINGGGNSSNKTPQHHQYLQHVIISNSSASSSNNGTKNERLFPTYGFESLENSQNSHKALTMSPTRNRQTYTPGIYSVSFHYVLIVYFIPYRFQVEVLQ